MSIYLPTYVLNQKCQPVPAADWDGKVSYAPRPVPAVTGWSRGPRPATGTDATENCGYLLAAGMGGRASFVWVATAKGGRGSS